MGWNEGIIAVKQITDEKKWFRAMEEVKGAFRRDCFFKEYPTDDKNAYFVNRDHEMKGVFDEKDNVKKWEITERLNFCEQGWEQQNHWDWQFFEHGQECNKRNT